jgi:alkylation response protein AidB-like acyl-CoA dehydrogenase
MNFGFNDEQQEIKSTARQFLESRFKPDVVRKLAEEGRYDDGLWREICELGWPGIAIAEENGGQGLGMVELAILCEELGYACAPVPFLSDVAAGLMIEAAGDEGQRAQWLPGIASGEARGAAAMERGKDAVIVPDAEGAAVLVLPAGDGGVLVEPSGAELERLELLDTTRAYYRVSASGGDPLGSGHGGALRAMVALAAELTGVAQRALDMSVAYAKEREQFDRPIGAYQAISHALAKMLYDVEEARSLTYYAAWAAGAEHDSLPLAAAMAKARASDAAWEVTKTAIQAHGGIGFTWEHDLHFLLKRARVGGQLLGTASEHRERVAAMAGMA